MESTWPLSLINDCSVRPRKSTMFLDICSQNALDFAAILASPWEYWKQECALSSKQFLPFALLLCFDRMEIQIAVTVGSANTSYMQ